MIAYAGYVRMRAGQTEALGFQARPRWPMESLNRAGADGHAVVSRVTHTRGPRKSCRSRHERLNLTR